MQSVNRKLNGWQEQPDDDNELERIARSLERLEQRFDEFARAFLNARFPHGRPVDRWGRRGA
jgi:hypothetical protein